MSEPSQQAPKRREESPWRAPQQHQVGQVTVVIISGFHTQSLNTTFHIDKSIPIGNRVSYWDQERRYFMYYQASEKRWAISCQTQGGDDLLLDAQRGGIRGLAYEAQKGGVKWREFFGGEWVTVEPQIQ